MRLTIVVLVVATMLGGSSDLSAEEPPNRPLEPRLSLHDAIQAAVDNNINIQLLKERIAAAQSATNTSRGALFPQLSGYATGQNQTVNLAAGPVPERAAIRARSVCGGIGHEH